MPSRPGPRLRAGPGRSRSACGAAGGGAYGPLGRTGLAVCRLGFGGYRVNDETPVHRSALERALAGGVNLVDTSTNYTDGGSERLVGQVVGEAIRRGRHRARGDRRRLEDRLRPGAEPGAGPGARGRRPAVPRDGALPAGLLALRAPRRSSRTSWPGRSTGWASDPRRLPAPQPRVLPVRRGAQAAARRSKRARDEFYRRLDRGVPLLRGARGGGDARVVRRVVEHGRAPGGRPGGDEPRPDAGRGRGGRRPRPPLRRPPAAHEPLRGGRRSSSRTTRRTRRPRRAAACWSSRRRKGSASWSTGRSTRSWGAGWCGWRTSRGAAGELGRPPAGGRPERSKREYRTGDRRAPSRGAGQRQARELPPLGGSARRRPGAASRA